MNEPLYSSFNVVTVPVGSDVVLVGPNLKRVALIIGAPAANRVDLGFRAAAVAGAGFPLWPKTAPIQFAVEYWIHAIREEIRATATGGPESIAVLEVFTG